MATSTGITEYEGNPGIDKSVQWAWTSGQDVGVEHIEKIAHGSFGEVHKMRYKETNKLFARKLIIPFAHLRDEEIQNELRAVAKFGKTSCKYIVGVFNYGRLSPDSPHYFIDMELCDMDLNYHIYHVQPGRNIEFQNSLPVRTDVHDIWKIMRDISSGLAFIHRHGEIHRDIKPRNSISFPDFPLMAVLFSKGQELWKIADFGFSTETASRTTIASKSSRGTPGYRPPELIAEISTFSSKVDIWGLGCILYELAVERKAFADDWKVHEYAVGKQKIHVPLEYFPSEISLFIRKLIHEMLHANPRQRPNAQRLAEVFAKLETADISAETENALLLPKIYESLFEDTASNNYHIQMDRTQPETPISVVGKNVVNSSNNLTRRVFSVRYEQNLHFTGRDDFLRRVAEELSERKPKRYNHRVALHGLGGVGKTQIALEYAYRHKNDYTFVFWISAADQTQLLSGFGEIATLTGCVRSDDDPNQVAKAVLRWLEVTEGWLLIIDNLDDITVIDGYLPTTVGVGHTLITTRNTYSAGIPAEGMEVMVMDIEDSLSLLLDGIQMAVTDEIRSEARKIVEALGFLPLAIEQAAGYIRISQMVEEYLETYTKQRSEILNWRATRNHAYNQTVGTTWKMSLKRLRETCPNAITLVRFLVFQNPDEILLEFLRAGAQAVHLELRQIIENNVLLRESLAALEGYSLIRVFGGQKIRIHRLVQAIIQDDMESQIRSQVISDVIQLGLQSFPAIQGISDQSQREICRRYRWQVAACLENTTDLGKTKPEWMALVDVLVEYLLEDGYYLDGLEWATMTEEIRKKTLGSWDESTLKNLTKMGIFYRHLGRGKEAVDLHEETLKTMKTVLGSEHQETLTVMNNLAVSYLLLGRYKEAAKLNKETADIRERLLGVEHQETLISMNNLAVSYNFLGKYEQAWELIDKTVKIRKRVSGSEHQETLISLKNLGRAYRNLGKVEDAIRLFQEITEVAKRVLGAEHPQTLVNLEELARSLRKMGRLEEAIEFHGKTLEIRKRVLGPNHPQTLSSMYGLACSLCSSGCALEALRLHKEALKIRKIVLPPEHPEIFDSMEGIADSLWSLGEKQEARQLYNAVLSARTTVLGEDHPATLRVAQRVDSASEMMEKSEGDRSMSAETEKESPPNC